MRLFSPELLRNFSVGFAVGALLVAGAHAESWGGDLSSPAQAATMPETLAPTAEFIIAPETAR